MGDWIGDRRHGQGVVYYANGNKWYEGDWADDKKNGKGIGYHTNGNKYEGDWVDGLFHGKGIYYFANGDEYDGESQFGGDTSGQNFASYYKEPGSTIDG